MKYLILDTSSNYLYLFLTNGEKDYSVVLEGRNNHSEKIMDLISDGLNKLNMEVGSLERIICGIGPGSYTGLRVALTICKMFSWAKDIPLYTISSLDILGSGYFNNDGTYAITNTAKRDYIYSKIIKVNGGKLETLQDDKFILKEEFIDNLDKGITLITEDNYKYDAKVILEIAKNKVDNIHEVEPNYLREALS